MAYIWIQAPLPEEIVSEPEPDPAMRITVLEHRAARLELLADFLIKQDVLYRRIRRLKETIAGLREELDL